MTKTKARPVGIWIRVSTEDQARGDSPEHHERKTKAYAGSKDWHVKQVNYWKQAGTYLAVLPEALNIESQHHPLCSKSR